MTPLQLDIFGSKRQRGRRLPPATEFAVHCAIADTLRVGANPGWYWTHIPSGEKRDTGTGARLKRMGLKPGLPDLMLISPDGRVHFLEIKRARLARTSEAQDAFLDEMPRRGIPCAVAYGYNQAIDQLKGWGALRTTVKVAV